MSRILLFLGSRVHPIQQTYPQPEPSNVSRRRGLHPVSGRKKTEYLSRRPKGPGAVNAGVSLRPTEVLKRLAQTLGFRALWCPTTHRHGHDGAHSLIATSIALNMIRGVGLDLTARSRAASRPL
jgi:hypothetical protein